MVRNRCQDLPQRPSTVAWPVSFPRRSASLGMRHGRCPALVDSGCKLAALRTEAYGLSLLRPTCWMNGETSSSRLAHVAERWDVWIAWYEAQLACYVRVKEVVAS